VLWVGIVPKTSAPRVEEPKAKTEIVEKEKAPEKKPAKVPEVKPEKKETPKEQAQEKKPEEPDEPASTGDLGPSDLGIKVMEGQEFKYSYYLSMILKKISGNWSRAPRSTRGLNAVVYFEIETDGSLSDVRIEEGSGDRDFDLRAERALILTKGFPPLPPSFGYDRLRVHIEFEGR
jgi:TonB family protein